MSESCETAALPAAPYVPPSLLSMSVDELRLEWRQQEDALVRYDRLVDAVIAALWGEDDELAEGPPPDDEVDGDTLVSGILSLHELNARLMLENEQLRLEREELRAELRAVRGA